MLLYKVEQRDRPLGPHKGIKMAYKRDLRMQRIIGKIGNHG